MAITRNIDPASILDKIDPLGTVFESSTFPGNTLNKTGWEEARLTNACLQSMGRMSVQINQRNINGTIRPAVGYFGDTFTEQSIESKTQTFEYIGGYTRFEIISQVKLTGPFPSDSTVRYKLVVAGATVIIAFIDFATALTTSDYVFTTTGLIGSNLLITNGEAERANFIVEYFKSNPSAQLGLGDDYYEGCIFATLILRK